MTPVQRADTAPPSPSTQALTPPDSPPRESSLRNVSECNLKQVLVDAIKQVLSDYKPFEVHTTQTENFQPPPEVNALQKLLKDIADPVTQLSKTKMGLVQSNTLGASNSAPLNETDDQSAVMGPSSCGPPNTPANPAGNLQPALDTDQLGTRLMEYRKHFLSNGLNGTTTNPENRRPVTRCRASKLDFKVVSEIWDKDVSKYKIIETTKTENEVADLEEFIFVVRERTDRKSSEVTAYIDINSECLCDVLRTVLRGVRVVSLMEDKPSIEQNVLFHFLPEMNDCLQNLCSTTKCDNEELEHLTLLINRIKDTHASISQRVSSLLPHGQITYDLLWALFKPGQLVYSTCFGTGKPRCVIFDAGEEVTHEEVTYYQLECRYLDFDGDTFGEAGINLGIVKFRGAKAIDSLEAFPLQYKRDHEKVRKGLIECGKKFRQLTNTHYQHCEGTAFVMKDGKINKVNINGQVVVDAAFFSQMQPNYSRPRIQDTLRNNSRTLMFSIDAFFSDLEEIQKGKVNSAGMESRQMGDDDLVVCCPTVRCFSFKEKRFLECAVADLREMEWSQIPFSCLKIPVDTKKLLLSLATTRLGLVPTFPFDDVIEGKGRGLNILLHGPPGVGKTFTVEATAEWFKLPLYSISAGELIVDHGDPHALEHQLDTIFKIARHFNAVLLLDEADAFMERRTSYHDAHNRLLTVFLRKLEYYDGILFLTSNRAIEFDDAVLSRIHLKIKYEDLNKEARREIWAHFLSKAQTPEGSTLIKDEDLRRLEYMELNGREIKNLTSIAHSLATCEAKRVGYEHLEMAAKSQERFVEEFNRPAHLEGMYT